MMSNDGWWRIFCVSALAIIAVGANLISHGSWAKFTETPQPGMPPQSTMPPHYAVESTPKEERHRKADDLEYVISRQKELILLQSIKIRELEKALSEVVASGEKE